MDTEKAWWAPREGRRLTDLAIHELLALKAGLELSIGAPADAAKVLESLEVITSSRGVVSL